VYSPAPGRQRMSLATPTCWSQSMGSHDLWCLSQLRMREVSQWQDFCSNSLGGSADQRGSEQTVGRSTTII
jgi:hypothetical protein